MKLKHLAAVFAFTIFVAFAILYYIAFYKPQPQDTNIVALSTSVPKSDGPGMAIGIKDGKTLILSWQNLPTGTSRIDVFRAKLACENWSKWKTTAIQNPISGSAEIKANENISSDCFYFKAVSGSGAQLWSSTPQGRTAYLGGDPTPQAGTSGGERNQQTNQSTSTSISNQTQGQTSTSTATQTTSTATQTTSTPAQPISTPTQSAPTVPDIVHTENFWVEHVNERIEIGWQNMSSGTQKIAVSRSETENGLWIKLFEQKGPFENKPYVIRLLDETINSPRYYKLEALSSSGTTLQTFGPLLLPALGQ